MIFRNHQKQKKRYSVAGQAEIFRRELNLPDTSVFENEAQPPMLGRVKDKAKRHAQDQIKQKWEERIGEKDNNNMVIIILN